MNHPRHPAVTAEEQRLHDEEHRRGNWKRWGTYLSERQWATVREDYSKDGTAWEYFPFEHSHSRAYRWGEDGLLGWSDREARLCFALALWNGKDPFLKERLFGVTGHQGNHGEDVKECYFYQDATPTHSYARALYKYPQSEFPYQDLLTTNQNRGTCDPEYELEDTGVFSENRYFDVTLEYAKASPEDTLITITVWNRGPDAAPLHLLPTLWFRNTWRWGCRHDDSKAYPRLILGPDSSIRARHATLGDFRFDYAPDPATQEKPLVWFTENETNNQKLFGSENETTWVKDAFHEALIGQNLDALCPDGEGSKACLVYEKVLQPGECWELRFRLHAEADQAANLTDEFQRLREERHKEANLFYRNKIPQHWEEDAQRIARQAYAGLIWTKQFYHYVVRDWLLGDPGQPPPPPERKEGRNADWKHVFARDVLSVCDKWEYPWFATWDLAFHMVAFAKIDPIFAKRQLGLFLREWYMHPNGQLPAYEWALSDVNPPVHAWAAWRVYKMTAARGERDVAFLERTFQKLSLDFTWWVNRKDREGNNLFAGGFLGMDNIGLFDRSKPLPTGGYLQQADGTAWMAFYASTMLSISLELALANPVYEDMASKFFEHFLAINDAINAVGGCGLWDSEDGFYYDHLRLNGNSIRLSIRSMVGLIPLLAVEVLEEKALHKLPGFYQRLNWSLRYRDQTSDHITRRQVAGEPGHQRGLFSVLTRDRLEKILGYMLDESEFLSPFGIRSLSKYHEKHPFILRAGQAEYRVGYEPGESQTNLFGGNSNWRGPIWFPINYLIIEALQRYHHFYGDSFQIECPTGSGKMMNLAGVAREISRRLASLFQKAGNGQRPIFGENFRHRDDPHWNENLLFHEYFHAETGQGLGAAHQTGWTALIVRLLEEEPHHP